tara:strand:+ start:18136 stop:18963 length:828 start_codon:yes stop_codon:yes gene_type:complete
MANMFLGMFAAISSVLLLLVLSFLVYETWPIIADGRFFEFLNGSKWYPLEGQFGMLPMILSSIAVMVGAIALAGPLGIASAVFLRFYARGSVERFYRLILYVLAGIPSVVFGLWGLTELVPLITKLHPPGTSLLAATLVLALMILPTVAITSTAALKSIPENILSGAKALGLSRQGQILHIAIPAAKTGIYSGLLLSMARALGETMAVVMVAGNVVQYPTGLFQPIRTLTANIALEMAYAMDGHRAGLFAAGLILTLLVLILSILASKASKGRFV